LKNSWIPLPFFRSPTACSRSTGSFRHCMRKQLAMFEAGSHQEHRIVSIDQPHAGPIRPRKGPVQDRVRSQDPSESGGRIFLFGYHLLGCVQPGQPYEMARWKITKSVSAFILQKYWQTKSTAPEKTGNG